MSLKNLNIDNTWTLFLDRDGVINKKLDNDYVKHWIEFEFIEGSILAIQTLSKLFYKIVVVTNQQGIGKRLYTVEDLEIIHKNMIYELEYSGGKIDKVYFSPYLNSENHPTRKPSTGMGVQAQKDFPKINFSKSIIVGDSLSDMQFGKSLGMYTVFISEKKMANELIDFNFSSLIELSNAIV
jgi:histidinol-phosphate phosphatase family protein